MKGLRITPTLITDALRVHWKWLIVPIIVVPVMAVAAASVVKPKLKASALVLVQEDVRTDRALQDYLAEVQVHRRIPAIASLVKSNKTLESVLRKLGEITEDMDAEEISWRVGSFRGEIDLYSEGAGLVRLSVVGRWPGRVYEGLNHLTEELVHVLAAPQTQALQDTVTFLELQTTRAKDELRTIEAAIRDVKESSTDLLPEVHKLNLEQYAKVSSDLLTAEADLVELEQRLEAYDSELSRRGSGGGGARVSDALSKARATLRQLKATFTAAHPDVQAAAAVVRQLEARQAAHAASSDGPTKPGKSSGRPRSGGPKAYKALVRDTEGLRKKVAYLGGRLDELVASIKSRTRREADLAAMVRDYEVKQKAYGNLLERYEDARVSHSLASSKAQNKIQVVEAPTRPSVAPQYSKLVMLIAGLIGGLFLGLSCVLGLELIDRTVRVPEEIEAQVDVPVVATMPHLGRVA